MEEIIGLLFIAVLATFAGSELIGKVPPQLHTPLMSGANAISGISIVGALLAFNKSKSFQESELIIITIIATTAIIFSTINVIGGYVVTDRMLKMFKKK